MSSGYAPAAKRAMFVHGFPTVRPETPDGPGWLPLGPEMPSGGSLSWTNTMDKTVAARWAAYLPDGRIGWWTDPLPIGPGESLTLSLENFTFSVTPSGPTGATTTEVVQ